MEGLLGPEDVSVLLVDDDGKLLHALLALGQKGGEERGQLGLDGHVRAHQAHLGVRHVGDGRGRAGHKLVSQFLERGVGSAGGEVGGGVSYLSKFAIGYFAWRLFYLMPSSTP